LARVAVVWAVPASRAAGRADSEVAGTAPPHPARRQAKRPTARTAANLMGWAGNDTGPKAVRQESLYLPSTVQSRTVEHHRVVDFAVVRAQTLGVEGITCS
jgi:hypothetical protein